MTLTLQYLGILILFILFIMIVYFFLFGYKKIIIKGDVTHEIIFYDPLQSTESDITINIGDTIKFSNKSVVRHSFTVNDSNIDNVPLLLPWEEYSQIFLEKGEYIYSSSLYEDSDFAPIKITVN